MAASSFVPTFTDFKQSPDPRDTLTGAPIYVLLTEGRYLTITGAISRDFRDRIVYNTEMYRDDINSNFVGSPAYQVVEKYTGSPPVVDGSEALAVSQADIAQSDAYTHTQPRPYAIVVTEMVWFDATGGFAGTGKIVGSCIFSQYCGTATAIPSTLQ